MFNSIKKILVASFIVATLFTFTVKANAFSFNDVDFGFNAESSGFSMQDTSTLDGDFKLAGYGKPIEPPFNSKPFVKVGDKVTIGSAFGKVSEVLKNGVKLAGKACVLTGDLVALSGKTRKLIGAAGGLVSLLTWNAPAGVVAFKIYVDGVVIDFVGESISTVCGGNKTKSSTQYDNVVAFGSTYDNTLNLESNYSDSQFATTSLALDENNDSNYNGLSFYSMFANSNSKDSTDFPLLDFSSWFKFDNIS
jgi:hypothetical protein